MTLRHPFQVGDRVVCINDAAPRTCNDAPTLDLGVVYTVTRVGFALSARDPDTYGPGVCVAEAAFSTLRHWWSAARFELHERVGRP